MSEQDITRNGFHADDANHPQANMGQGIGPANASIEVVGPEFDPDTGERLRQPTEYELAARKRGNNGNTAQPTVDASGEPINVWSDEEQRWLGQGEWPSDALDRQGRPKHLSQRRKTKRCLELVGGRDGRPRYRCSWNTTYPTDYCWRHGGNAERARLLSDRRYATLLGSDVSMQSMFLAFLDDPDITDLRAELALQRTLLGAVLGQMNDAGLTLDKVSAESIITLTGLNQAVARLAESVDKINSKAGSTITLQQMEWFVEQIVNGVYDVVQDLIQPEVRADAGTEGISGVPGLSRDDASSLRRSVLERIADALEEVIVPIHRGRAATKGLVAQRAGGTFGGDRGSAA